MAEPTVEFEDNTIKVLNALDNAYIAWLYEAAGELEAQAKRNTKVGKISGGKTKGKWKYEVEVILHVPRSNEDSAVTNVVFKLAFFRRTDGKIVVKNYGLRVEVETVFLVFLQYVEQIVDEVYQTHTEVFKREIPFSVPVGV